MDVGEWKNGIYFFRVFDENNKLVGSEKILKIH